MKKMMSLMMIAILGAFVIMSCNKGDNPVESDYDAVYDSYGFVSSDLDETEVSDLSVEQPMGFKNGPGPIKKMIPLKGILRKLELTDAQKEQVQVFNQQHKDCIEAAMTALRASERAIIEAANEERRAVLADLENEVITKEEARELMKEIALETKTALRENPLRESTKLAVKECIELFFENIGGILTEEQLVIWEEFLTKVEEHRPNGHGRP